MTDFKMHITVSLFKQNLNTWKPPHGIIPHPGILMPSLQRITQGYQHTGNKNVLNVVLFL